MTLGGMNKMTTIQVYTREDLKKSGGFKKKNNVKEFSQEEFFDYLRDNDLDIKSDYIDATGTITDGSKFRAFMDNGLIIGTSGIVKELNITRRS